MNIAADSDRKFGTILIGRRFVISEGIIRYGQIERDCILGLEPS